MRAFAATAIAATLLFGAAACSEDYTREDGIQDLQDELDLDETTATCFVDTVEAEGVSIQDAATESKQSEPEIVAALTKAADECISTADLGDALNSEDVDEQDIRDGFVNGFTSGGQFTEDQANCFYDELVGNGVEITDLIALDRGEIDASAFDSEFAAAAEVCA